MAIQINLTLNFNNLNEINETLKHYSNSELLIVSKNRSISVIKELIKNGYTHFGENRVQEAQDKFSNLKNLKIKLDMIGPLQTNKVKMALDIFDTIQTVDRIKLVDSIVKNILNNKNIRTKFFYIQVNIGDEKQKSGVKPYELSEFYDYCMERNLNIIGLMCIPPNLTDPTIYFNQLIDLRDSINKNLKLSMGMSNDYKFALKAGSNLIRVGSKIFD